MIAKIIATGSSGNMICLVDKDNRYLILDAGVNINQFLKAINYNSNRVDAVLFSHHHL